MVTSDPATGPGDATVPWAGNRSMRGTQSSESESPRNDRPDARAVFVFRLLMHAKKRSMHQWIRPMRPTSQSPL